MKKTLKILITTAIFFAITAPFLIHILFKIEAAPFFQAEWSAGDALSYVGSIIGVFATMATIIVTVMLTKNEREAAYEKQKEQYRIAIKPYLQISYKQIVDYGQLNCIKTGKDIYVKLWPDSSVASTVSYPLTINDIVETENEKNYMLWCSIRNVGSGNAINVQLNLDGYIVLNSTAIPSNEEVVLVFLFNREQLSFPEKRFTISLEYSDVALYAKYSQIASFHLYVNKSDDFVLGITGDCQRAEQKRIEK